MYPYPSGDLHIGHWYAATGPDIVARMRRMQGLNVMFPMGFDAFGLPAENAAIDRGIHPAIWTNSQHRAHARASSGPWARASTGRARWWPATPDYYRWTQWLFLQFYRAGLAYRADGGGRLVPEGPGGAGTRAGGGADRHCWRCGTPVIKRDLEQWFFRITNYADELLDFSGMDWPEPIRLMQTNWIGRSEGAEIAFAVEADDVEPIRVFTTRPDTVFGATFMVLAPEHPLVPVLTTDEQRGEVEAYVAAARRETEIERLSADREKTGVFIGAYAINPMNQRAHPDLDRGLRAARLRHRRDHGRARPRRARLRLRAEVRPADAVRRARRRPASCRTARRSWRTPPTRCWSTPASSPACRPAEAIGAITSSWPTWGIGGPAVSYQHPRLAGQPPALLGRTDPHRLLPRARRPAGAGGPAAGPAAGGRRLHADRRSARCSRTPTS